MDEVFYVMNCTLISVEGRIFWNTIHQRFLLQILPTDINKENLHNDDIQD